jgi:hypothetical protein
LKTSNSILDPEISPGLSAWRLKRPDERILISMKSTSPFLLVFEEIPEILKGLGSERVISYSPKRVSLN